MKPFVVVNPTAGSITDLGVLLKQFRRLGPAKVYVTRGPGEAEIVTRKAIRSGRDFIVAAGGDGTLNEVVNGIASTRHARDIRMGLIPLGTGNDFARSLGLPARMEDNIEILRAGRTTSIDLVRGTSGCTRYFINVSTGGFSGAVDEKLTPKIKRDWGPLAYLRGAAAALPQLHSYRAIINLDQKETLSLDLYNAVVANGRFVAGGLPIAPEADLGDGLLDVILIPAHPAGELALLAAQILLGKHLRNKAILFRHAKKIAVKSRPKMWFNVDGEPVGTAPIVFEVVPKALTFVTNK